MSQGSDGHQSFALRVDLSQFNSVLEFSTYGLGGNSLHESSIIIATADSGYPWVRWSDECYYWQRAFQIISLFVYSKWVGGVGGQGNKCWNAAPSRLGKKKKERNQTHWRWIYLRRRVGERRVAQLGKNSKRESEEVKETRKPKLNDESPKTKHNWAKKDKKQKGSPKSVRSYESQANWFQKAQRVSPQVHRVIPPELWTWEALRLEQNVCKWVHFEQQRTKKEKK